MLLLSFSLGQQSILRCFIFKELVFWTVATQYHEILTMSCIIFFSHPSEVINSAYIVQWLFLPCIRSLWHSEHLPCVFFIPWVFNLIKKFFNIFFLHVTIILHSFLHFFIEFFQLKPSYITCKTQDLIIRGDKSIPLYRWGYIIFFMEFNI